FNKQLGVHFLTGQQRRKRLVALLLVGGVLGAVAGAVGFALGGPLGAVIFGSVVAAPCMIGLAMVFEKHRREAASQAVAALNQQLQEIPKPIERKRIVHRAAVETKANEDLVKIRDLAALLARAREDSHRFSNTQRQNISEMQCALEKMQDTLINSSGLRSIIETDDGQSAWIVCTAA
ncbi:MAG: hypothetical protein KDK78_01190, partial [Chlamydiia bacterium]|nr:hypothetical protein [Chlamydiia bacterium]